MPTYEQIAYDSFVRRRQHSEHSQLPGIELGHSDGPFEGLDGPARKMIRQAQHFFLATVTGEQWPYVQHRGGPVGFVHVSDDGRRLAWAEFHGNNQFVTTGNTDRDGRMCLFFVDYPLRRRLKVFGQARVVKTRDDPKLLEWVTTLGPDRMRQPVARIMVLDVVATDVNCSKHIQPRWTKERIDETAELYRRDLDTLRERVAELEEERARLVEKLKSRQE